MGFHPITGTSHRYGLIAYDKSGSERPEAGGYFTRELIQEMAAQDVTDVFFFSHGWKGDVPAAIAQYDSWIGSFLKSADLGKGQTIFPNFRPFFIGLHWPSLPWGDEEARGDGTFAAQDGPSPDALLVSYTERLGDDPGIRDSLRIIFDEARRNISPDVLPPQVCQAYLDLNNALGLGSGGISAPPDADREGFDPNEAYEATNNEEANFGKFSLGGILGPLRQLSYWAMKKRARTVGEGGMHDFLKALQTATTSQRARVHLMGHSFGTIVVSGMLGGPNCRGALQRPVDSVALVQGAVSLWSYAQEIPFPGADPGYFSRILMDKKIAGPIMTTQSRLDKAVGLFYPIASQINGSTSFVVTDEFPKFGALGAYGLQGLDDSIRKDIRMLPADSDYNFKPGLVYNLESSEYICHGDGASGAHSDITGPEVAHAIWGAAFASNQQRQ